jgi:hypothetical protein
VHSSDSGRGGLVGLMDSHACCCAHNIHLVTQVI